MSCVVDPIVNQSGNHGYHCESNCGFNLQNMDITVDPSANYQQQQQQNVSSKRVVRFQALGYNCGFNLQNVDTILDPSAKYQQQQQQQQHNVSRKW